MSKIKGTRAERELLHKFWDTKKWAVMRAPASGATKHASPDLLVGNRLKKLAIECKYCSGIRQYLSKDEVKQLHTFANIFGAEPWIAVKFARKGWYFLITEDMDETEKNYVVSQTLAERKGLRFEEII